MSPAPAEHNIIAGGRNRPTLLRVKMDRLIRVRAELRNCYGAARRAVHGGRILRFDDSLDTVLGADMATPFGAQSAWRQLTDLIGRRRAADLPEAIARLRSIRALVPPQVRAASARSLAFAMPPADLVRLSLDRAGGNELASGKFTSPESRAALAANGFGWFCWFMVFARFLRFC